MLNYQNLTELNFGSAVLAVMSLNLFLFDT